MADFTTSATFKSLWNTSDFEKGAQRLFLPETRPRTEHIMKLRNFVISAAVLAAFSIFALTTILPMPARALTSGQRASLSVPSYDPAALTYFAQLASNGCLAPTNGFKRIVSNFFAAERVAGNLSAFDFEYLLVTADSCTASTNMAQPSLYRVTWSGSCVFGITQGFKGDSATCFGDTGVNISALTRASQNNVFEEMDQGLNSTNNTGISGAGSTIAIGNASTAKTTNIGSTTAITDSSGPYIGDIWAWRSASSTATTGHNAVTDSNNVSNTSSSPSAAHLLICKRNASFCGNNARMYFVSVGSVPPNVTAHVANMRTMLAALGASSP